MTKNDKEENLSKKVMEDIKSQDIKMHSKLYFRLLSWSLIASSALFIMLASITGLIAYRQIMFGRGLNLTEFGGRGRFEFFVTLPWLAMGAGLMTFLAAYLLIKHFDISYRYRLSIVLIALLVAVAGLSAVFAQTGIEKKARDLPPFKGMHSFENFSDEKRIAGEILEVDSGEITVQTEDGEVNIDTSEARKRPTYEYKVGDTVTAFGMQEESGDTFKAYGVRPSDGQGPPQVRGAQNRSGNRFLK